MEKHTVINVEGMTCASCAMSVTRLLEKKGLKNVNVSLATGEVAFENGAAKMNDIVTGINDLGYKVIDKEESSEAKESRFSPLEIKFIVALVFTIPLLLHMLFQSGILHNPVIQLLLCMPVIFIGLRHFGKSAWA